MPKDTPPILIFRFILLTLAVFGGFDQSNAKLNKHLPSETRQKITYRPQVIR
jgi:polar amino acid transport system permease protein